MQVEIAVLADAANISREGKLNICGVFQHIYGQAVPIGWPMMSLVLQLRLLPEETGKRHTLIIRLNGPDGKLVQQFPDAQFEAPADPGSRKVTVPLTANFAGLVFPGFGLYGFELVVDGKSLSTIELEVGQIPMQRPGHAA
jgi:hypothetical protein